MAPKSFTSRNNSEPFSSLSSKYVSVKIIVGFLNRLNSIFEILFAILIEKDAGFYECAHCHHKYIPTFKSVLWAIHINRTRYMKCPKCGEKELAEENINKKNL